MTIIRRAFRFLLLAFSAILFSGAASTIAAQTGWQNSNPCASDSSGSALSPEVGTTPDLDRPAASHGLKSVDDGLIVYDSNQNVCWLADANPAGNPLVRAAVKLSPYNPDGTLPVINPDGTMNWETALNWVNALNNYNNGRGWLGHKNWQLPSNPAVDLTCSAVKTNNFGAQCTGSGMGNLYNVGLAETFPNSVVPRFLNFVWPFFNLQPGLYWTADPGPGTSGEFTFSFNTGIRGANTVKYNFFHALPMTTDVLGPLPPGTGVLPYLSGPGAGRAVYDTHTGLSWPLDANLPAFDNFGVTGTIQITADQNGQTNGGTITAPLVNKDGTTYLSIHGQPQTCLSGAFTTSGLTSQWILSMAASSYAGSKNWQLPCHDDLQKLYDDLTIATGDVRLEWPLPVGPFSRLQPGFYWGCVRVPQISNNGDCDYTQSAPGGLDWSFDFEDGFLGTDETTKEFYVMVYFLAP
jgi:hypothetical protein